MRRLQILAPLALLSILFLAACGNMGPLVRPPVEAVEPLEDEAIEEDAGREAEAEPADDEAADAADADGTGDDVPPSDPVPA